MILRCRWFTLPVLLLALLTGCADELTGPPGTVPLDVFVHAHQDDWQLFMGDRVHQSVQDGNKVVLIYTTAGDAGSSPAYWQMRERAAQASVDRITGPGATTCATQQIGSHPIRRCVKETVVSYYMGMPDGNYLDGTGYGYGSLNLLRDQGIATGPRDRSTTYTSWSDFTTTIARIIEHESASQNAARVSVHAPDHDRTVNPGNHPDHWATGDAVRAAAAGRDWTVAWYIDYATEYLDRNLGEEAHAAKRMLFKAYDDVMAEAGYERLIDRSNFQAWLWRTYFRTESRAAN